MTNQINNNKPDAYQKGYIEFYKLKFKLTEDVLIPRPETELLVDEVLNRINSSKFQTSNSAFTILDIGTGSGNIAISIAKNLPSYIPDGNIKIIATEVSKKALQIAKQNAKLHGVQDKIEFVESNLLDSVPYVIPAQAGIQKMSKDLLQIEKSMDPGSESGMTIKKDYKLIIVTNLPYIPTDRINYLDSSVKDFEPHVALDGGQDGFELYRKLFAEIKEQNLKPNLLLGEIDYTHGEIAATEAKKYFPQAIVEVRTDLAHRQRILYIQN